MAKAGSCKIGLNPNPSSCDGIILSKGLDVRMVNNTKPVVINAWVSKVFEIKLKFELLYNLNKKKLNIVKTSIHNNIDPSWLPQTPEIL